MFTSSNILWKKLASILLRRQHLTTWAFFLILRFWNKRDNTTINNYVFASGFVSHHLSCYNANNKDQMSWKTNKAPVVVACVAGGMLGARGIGATILAGEPKPRVTHFSLGSATKTTQHSLAHNTALTRKSRHLRRLVWLVVETHKLIKLLNAVGRVGK